MPAPLINFVAALVLAFAPAVTAEPPPDPFGAYLRQALDGTALPGLAAVVTRGDQVVYAGGLGRDATGRPVTADTAMRVASLSKSFTAAAVLSLVDDGRLGLDDPVVRHLPEFRMADPRAAQITVRQLLDQTSGLSDTTVGVGATQRADTLTGYVAALRAGTLAAAPGSHWEYCNVNYDLAARLVEITTGHAFADALRERVFAPLGMRSSTVGGPPPADGFNSLYGWWVPRRELPGFRTGGAGGVITTANDLGRWLISQNGHGPQTLTPAALTTMHTRSAVADYAMGWGRQSVDGHTMLVHAGNLFTYTAVEAIDPDSGTGYAVLTNSAALQDDTYDILHGLVAVADGRTPQIPGGTRQTIELILALALFTALGLAVVGVVRSGRWARRHGRRGWWRLIVLLLPAATLATYPQWVSVLMNGRTVTWAQLTYFAAPLSITLSAAALAGLVTATVRVVRLRSVGSHP